ncbi:MAG: hypothetical protein E7J63_12875 [Pantoea sp.]|jgi:hypothetical protein|uniref:hypothetical protein n=1 Tax=Pantoea sp. TaxID=69393 RepID=UPI000ED7EC87|nr:hypothetical protein [Pantoea sp.]MDU6078934.1 hypothetical protein [Pantoea sp.]MDU7839188.1 hypothetical protein [Pantoea sp.]HAB25514.1 hypothetical protein [Pantoea sp.]
MLNFLNPRFRRVRARHNLPYAQSDVQGTIPVTSIVIPCTGEDYVEEAKLSALFAERFATAAQEIVIVSDQPAAAFGELTRKTRIVTLEVPHREEAYPYKQIYRSRLIKMQAPLHAQGDGILMIDSDLNLLKMPDIHMKDGHFYSSFRQGKMIAKLAGAAQETIPAYYQLSVRPYLEDHVNGAYLAATRQTWQRVCPLWLTLFDDTWKLMNDSQPPTDQLPLACLLDLLDLRTVNLGEWANWPVSKRIGGKPGVIPPEVVGAHGGFPLSEWQKYLADPRQPLTFKGQDYTRKVRYLTDAEKQQQ